MTSWQFHSTFILFILSKIAIFYKMARVILNFPWKPFFSFHIARYVYWNLSNLLLVKFWKVPPYSSLLLKLLNITPLSDAEHNERYINYKWYRAIEIFLGLHTKFVMQSGHCKNIQWWDRVLPLLSQILFIFNKKGQ